MKSFCNYKSTNVSIISTSLRWKRCRSDRWTFHFWANSSSIQKHKSTKKNSEEFQTRSTKKISIWRIIFQNFLIRFIHFVWTETNRVHLFMLNTKMMNVFFRTRDLFSCFQKLCVRGYYGESFKSADIRPYTRAPSHSFTRRKLWDSCTRFWNFLSQ